MIQVEKKVTPTPKLSEHAQARNANALLRHAAENFKAKANEHIKNVEIQAQAGGVKKNK